MVGVFLVAVGALTAALVVGALLDPAAATASARRSWSSRRDELRRSSLQLDHPPRCCS